MDTVPSLRQSGNEKTDCHFGSRNDEEKRPEAYALDFGWLELFTEDSRQYVCDDWTILKRSTSE